jgi:hypothetical protein
MYVLYYASMLQCWHLVWILVMTDHPCLGVGCHTCCSSVERLEVKPIMVGKMVVVGVVVGSSEPLG